MEEHQMIQQQPSQIQPQQQKQQLANKKFKRDSHINYLLALDKSKDLDSIGFYLTEHLRVGGAYWSLSGLACLKHAISEEKQIELIKWLKTCQNVDGGFGGNTGHDSHITSTHYAVLVFILFGELKQIDTDRVVQFISKLQQSDGSFLGDSWGECDTRFSYCALSSLSLLQGMHTVDVAKACEFVLSCRNYDGSFGGLPDMESHAAYVFTAVGALKIGGYLESLDNMEDLATWLSERQTMKGGFNGRPEKLPDVCYSWWIFASLKMLKFEKWINQPLLEQYILECQDEAEGGFSDKPGNQVDVFHSYFGLATLSMLDMQGSTYGLDYIDPIYALPQSILRQQFPHLQLLK